MYLLEGVEDKEMLSVIGGVDAVLVVEAGFPKCLEFLLLPHFGIFGDRWIVFVEGGLVLVERLRCPWLMFVGCIGEDKACDFACFRTGEANLETRLKEDFINSSKAVVLWLANDGVEGLDGGFPFCGDIH